MSCRGELPSPKSIEYVVVSGFLKGCRATIRIETLPFVEQYARYSLSPSMKDSSDRNSLYNQDGDLTPVGVAY